jgi:hypothetical protein
MSKGPRARSADLIVDNIGDELLVYDIESSRAHSLNNVGAAVWRACDGTRSAEQIAAHTGLDPSAVELALDNLSDVELISGHERTGISRRTALRRITVGAAGLAVALPVIRSITAPTAAMALSTTCTVAGDTCNLSTLACCSGSFCDGSSKCHVGSGVSRSQPCRGNNSYCRYGSVCSSGSQGGGSGHPACHPRKA